MKQRQMEGSLMFYTFSLLTSVDGDTCLYRHDAILYYLFTDYNLVLSEPLHGQCLYIVHLVTQRSKKIPAACFTTCCEGVKTKYPENRFFAPIPSAYLFSPKTRPWAPPPPPTTPRALRLLRSRWLPVTSWSAIVGIYYKCNRVLVIHYLIPWLTGHSQWYIPASGWICVG